MLFFSAVFAVCRKNPAVIIVIFGVYFHRRQHHIKGNLPPDAVCSEDSFSQRCFKKCGDFNRIYNLPLLLRYPFRDNHLFHLARYLFCCWGFRSTFKIDILHNCMVRRSPFGGSKAAFFQKTWDRPGLRPKFNPGGLVGIISGETRCVKLFYL